MKKDNALETIKMTDQEIKQIIEQERNKHPVYNKYQLSFEVAKRILTIKTD